ncbi:MAG: polyprenyl diphosphate synthase [Candidatus Buchananbacteria bacterium]
MAELNHLAIIMDGNRRWAKERGKIGIFGHQEGYKRFKEIAQLCRKKGINTLTVYAFSTENWKRENEEVDSLIGLLRFALDKEIDGLHKDNIRVRILGRRDNLPKDLQKSITEAEERTKNNNGGNLNIAISYGGREEITNAVRRIVASGISSELITEEIVADNLYTGGQADPELLVRCGGQKRLSNFLLWQLAYTEIYFSDVFWPDFNESELDKALEFFNQSKRNFGK